MLDSSGSITAEDFTKAQNALQTFADELLVNAETPTQFAMVEFNTTAQRRFPFSGDPDFIKTEINRGRVVTTTVGAHGPFFTNYDDGLRKAHELFTDGTSGRRTDSPNLIVFASDGVPTRQGHLVPNGAADVVAIGASDPFLVGVLGEIPEWLVELDAGISGANIARDAAGVNAQVIAIGLSLIDAGRLSLAEIAAENDVITTDFDQFASELQAIAVESCGGTITVNKQIDDGGLSNGGAGWQFTAAISGAGEVSDATDPDGNVVLDLDLTATAEVVISETGVPAAGASLVLKSIACSVDGEDAGGTFNASAGTYTLSVAPASIVSCTVINGPVPEQDGFLTVRKAVKNAAGGTATGGDFDLFIGEQPVSRGKRVQLAPGTYSVTENGGPTGYTGEFSGDCDASGVVQVGAGDDLVCTITNTYGGSFVHVTKAFVDDTILPDANPEVTITVGGDATGGVGDGDTASAGPFSVGTDVSILEDAIDATQYASDLVCSDAQGTVDVSPDLGAWGVTVGAGDIDCTLTNTRLSATLHVTKLVHANDDGSTYQIAINGLDVGIPIGNGEATGGTRVPANFPLTVTEAGPAAQSTTHSCEFGEISGTGPSIGPFEMVPGADLDCTFTNTLAEPPQTIDLTVRKTVNVQLGAAAPTGNFEILLDCGPEQALTFSPGPSGGVSPALTVEGGASCTLTESDAQGANEIQGEFFSPQPFTSSQELEILNTFFAPDLEPITITVQKVVVDNDGTAPDAAFSVEVICDGGTTDFLLIAGGGTDFVGGIAAGSSCSVFEVFGDEFPEPDQILNAIPFGSPQPFFSDATIVITNIYGEAPTPVVVQAAPPPPPITVIVTKAVTTSGLGQAPAAGTQFGFRLDCLGPDFDFTLAGGQSFSATVAANTLCSLTETDSRGAADVSGAFGETLLTANSAFTVTNNYHEDEPVVAGTNITKTLTSADPAAVGEPVVFEVAVTFEGGVLPNAELIDVYERAFVEFVAASVAGVPLSCDVFEVGPDGMVACALGDAGGPFTVQLTYVAVQATVPDRTLDAAELRFDLDGPGGDPPQTIGPVRGDVRSSRCSRCRRSATAGTSIGRPAACSRCSGRRPSPRWARAGWPDKGAAARSATSRRRRRSIVAA